MHCTHCGGTVIGDTCINCARSPSVNLVMPSPEKFHTCAHDKTRENSVEVPDLGLYVCRTCAMETERLRAMQRNTALQGKAKRGQAITLRNKAVEEWEQLVT